MPRRQNVFSPSQWEDKVGYARAVRVGGLVFVAGTTSTDPETGAVIHRGDMAGQVRQTFANVQRALERTGATLRDVVRVTMYTTDLKRFDEIGPVHRAYFGKAWPAATVVEVRRLAHADLLFEAEVTAAISGEAGR